METQDMLQFDESQSADVFAAKKEMKRVGAFFLIMLILEIPLSFIVHFVQSVRPDEQSTLISVLFTQGYLLCSALIYMAIFKKKFTRDLQVKKYKVSTFFLSLVMLLTAAPMASWLNLVSQLFAKNNTSTAILSISQQVPMWLGILIVGCLPGFIEETIYRGIMFQAFCRRSVLTGILISAISFGVMHMNFNQMLYAIYLGVIFAFLVEATGSISSTMILHMLFNAINTSYLYILPKLFEFLGKYSSEYANVNLEDMMSQGVTKQQILLSMTIWTPLAIGGLVLTALLLKAIAKINGRELTKESILGKADRKAMIKPVTVCLILGWIFCLVNAILELIAG